jgi:hypothetical protein
MMIAEDLFCYLTEKIKDLLSSWCALKSDLFRFF